MTVNKRQPIYQNIQLTMSRIIEDWQMKDKVVLFGELTIYEAILHWVWIAIVVINDTYLHLYVVSNKLMILFIICTSFIAIMLLITHRTEPTSQSEKRFTYHQALMLSVYSIYICTFILMLGQDSFFAGVSLIGGIFIAMLLMDRKIVCWLFSIQCVVVVCLMVMPMYVGELPSLKHDMTDYYLQADTKEILRKYNMFWRMSYLFLGLPKVIIIIYTVRKLLDALDERKRRIKYQAEYDELTKIRNRRSLLDFARHDLTYGKNITDKSIIIIDIDYFKQINDTYGHLVGDEVLYKVAQLLKSNIPINSEIGRYGGEEFLIVLPNTDTLSAIDIAESLRQKLESEPIDTGDDHLIKVTASFGIASLDLECIKKMCMADKRILDNRELRRQFNIRLDDIIKLGLKNADKALYEAKETGRNRVVASATIELTQLKQSIFTKAIG